MSSSVDRVSLPLNSSKLLDLALLMRLNFTSLGLVIDRWLDMTLLKVCPAATDEPLEERRDPGAEAVTIWAMQKPHEDLREQDWSEQLHAVSVSEKQSSSVEQSELVVESTRLLIETLLAIAAAAATSDRISELAGGGHGAATAAVAWAHRVSWAFSPSSSTL